MDISIGELARLTGLPVKTIRYYSDLGLAPEAGRGSSSYRRYDEAGLARIELVRTLRTSDSTSGPSGGSSSAGPGSPRWRPRTRTRSTSTSVD
jgi:hypothetical protein